MAERPGAPNEGDEGAQGAARADTTAVVDAERPGGKTRPFRFGLDNGATADVPLEPGALVGGRYTVLREIGKGGMGRVYEAEHLALRNRVAVKVLRTDRRGGEYQARFRQEAEAASRVGHPAIVAITDFAAADEGVSYMVMELLRGESLEDWLERPGRLRDGLTWLAELSRGLYAAHAAGIVHRDLKPANLFLHHGLDGRVQPKVLDFGIAKVSTTDHTAIATAAGTVLGTPYYLAPERALGRPLDGRADLYSMGVVLYEILTGTVPFVDSSYMGVLLKHVKVAPLDPRQAAAERAIPDGVAQLAMALLAKDPGDRPANALVLADALDRCLRDEGDAIDRVVTGPRAASTEAGVTTGIDELSQRPTAVPDAGAPRLAVPEPGRVPEPSRAFASAAARAPTRALGSNAMRDGLPAAEPRRSRVPLGLAIVVVACGLGAAGWALSRGPEASVAAEIADPPTVAEPIAAPLGPAEAAPPPTPVTPTVAAPARVEAAVVIERPVAEPAPTPAATKPKRPRPKATPKPTSSAVAPGGTRPPPLK